MAILSMAILIDILLFSHLTVSFKVTVQKYGTLFIKTILHQKFPIICFHKYSIILICWIDGVSLYYNHCIYFAHAHSRAQYEFFIKQFLHKKVSIYIIQENNSTLLKVTKGQFGTLRKVWNHCPEICTFICIFKVIFRIDS